MNLSVGTGKREATFHSDASSSYGADMTKMGRGPIDEEVREQIRNWIRYEMRKRQIDSIRDFCSRIHVSHSYVSRILLGESSPGLELCLRMRKYLHVSVDAMLDGNPPGM